MTGQIVIKSSPVSLNRRQPLLDGTLTPVSTKSSSSNVGEVAGGTAAGCFVVCCCCPCVLLECLFLAVYKVPVNLCRRFWLKRRLKIREKRIRRKGGVIQHATSAVTAVAGGGEGEGGGGGCGCGYSDELSDVDMKEFEKIKVSIDGSDDAVKLDKLMWDQFQNAGFWRSPSQRFA